jgi:hypothetical protein
MDYVPGNIIHAQDQGSAPPSLRARAGATGDRSSVFDQPGDNFVGIQNREFRAHRISHLRPGGVLGNLGPVGCLLHVCSTSSKGSSGSLWRIYLDEMPVSDQLTLGSGGTWRVVLERKGSASISPCGHTVFPVGKYGKSRLKRGDGEQ